MQVFFVFQPAFTPQAIGQGGKYAIKLRFFLPDNQGNTRIECVIYMIRKMVTNFYKHCLDCFRKIYKLFLLVLWRKPRITLHDLIWSARVDKIDIRNNIVPFSAIILKSFFLNNTHQDSYCNKNKFTYSELIFIIHHLDIFCL